MKYISRLLLFSLVLAAAASCTKDEHKIFLVDAQDPVLTASSTADMVLDNNKKDEFAITFSWTNPEYRFTTGVSSQDVTYTLQFDTAGVNFTSAGLQEMTIANDLSVSLSVRELNGFLSKMELSAGTAYNMEMRIKASLVNGSLPLYSNVIKIKITPYLDFAVEPPGTAANNYSDGQLWLVGDASANGWSNPLPSPYDASQRFTRIDVLHYELVIPFNATGGYKLIQEQGNWDTQYHALDGTAKLSGSFEKKNSDPTFPSPGAGTYKVEVNFQTGKYTLTKQ
jgi:hypothetical protein